MLNEKEQSELMKILFPKDTEEISAEKWDEFQVIIHFDEKNEETRKEIFNKYAQNAKKSIRDSSVASVLIGFDPTLASLALNGGDQCILDTWYENYYWHEQNRCRSFLINFVRAHADSCVEFLNECFRLSNNFSTYVCATALENEKFCEMIENSCKTQLKTGKEQKNSSFVSYVLYDMLSSRSVFDGDDVSQVLSNAAEKCPHALMIKNMEGYSDEKTRKSIMEHIILDLSQAEHSNKNINEPYITHLAELKAYRDYLVNDVDRKIFDKTITIVSPIALMLVKIEESHPEIFEVKNEDGVSLAKKLGFQHKNSEKSNLKTKE